MATATKEKKLSTEDQSLAVATIKPADLKHLKELDVTIAGFKKKYSGLKIKDENDKEGLEAIRLALGEMRPTRTGLDKERKKVTEPYRLAASHINSLYDEKIDAIADVEAPLKARKDEVEEIIENIKQKELQDKEEKLNNRINEFIKAGAAFDGNYYSLKDDALGIPEVSVGVVDVRTMSDEIYKNYLQQFIDKNALILSEKERLAKIESERIAEEKRLEEEQREKLRQEQEELKKQQDELQKQRDEIRLQKEEFDRQQKEQNDKMLAELEAKRKEKITARYNQLAALGLRFNGTYGCYALEDVNVDNGTEICLLNDTDWDTLIEKITPRIAEIKLELQQKEEQARQLAQQQIADKAIADKQIQDKLDQEKREAELAQASDKVKWNDYVAKLQAITPPEMKSTTYKSKVNAIAPAIKSLV